MASVIIDRIGTNVALSALVKTPCLVASTTNLTLSASATAATIDGITISTGDRVLVWQQDSTSENGIYTVGSSAWTRATDFNGTGDCVRGTLLMSAAGAAYGAKLFYVNSTGINVPGSSNITFNYLFVGGPN